MTPPIIEPVAVPIAKQENRRARIAAYTFAGLFGLFALALGGSWFVAGRGVLLAGFPPGLAEAFVSAAGGAVIVAWAASRLRREMRPGGEA